MHFSPVELTFWVSEMSTTYLIAYNWACCLGWTFVLALGLRHLVDGESLKSSLEQIYLSPPYLAPVLITVQLGAVLEVLHAAIGLVRSSVAVTAMQVSSRLLAVYVLLSSHDARVHWGSGCMILAWSLAEIPRYALYTALLLKKSPYPLFWMRYSGFIVLYPIGITGELISFSVALRDPTFTGGMIPTFLLHGFYKFVMLLYIPGSPFMWYNLYSIRGAQMKKRFAKPAPPPRGVVFPIDANGERSTSEAGKNVLAKAVASVDKSAAEKIMACRSWRFGYAKHIMKMVELQCKSPEAAVEVAEAGLRSLYESFDFIRADGTAVSFDKAMTATNEKKFESGSVKGSGQRAQNEYEVPYKGKTLSGDKLRAQIKKWVQYGTIEESAAKAINLVIENPKWLDLSDKYFVMLGAGSAMGPYEVLMSLGANIVAVDLDRPGIWKRLIQIARDSPGTITFPVKKSQNDCQSDEELFANAGCNLFTETPEIKDWVLGVCQNKEVVVGSYAYLDGAAHVQVALAMDAICKALSEQQKATLAYLCTPTDAHLCPKEAAEASLREFKRFSIGRVFEWFCHFVSWGSWLKRNYRPPVKGDDAQEYHIVDGLAVAQGPNYALAKRMQHWRAIVAREKTKVTVSSNIAPATSTASVVHARTFAWAYEGMPYFRPYEIFAPETSKAVMLALLIQDIRNKSSVANPNTLLTNPNELFMHQSFNGGCWRCAYTVSSIGEVSVLVYFSRVAAPYIGALASLFGLGWMLRG
eukprot:GHVN01059604.1.p1 GENE.GHVN01059604.1~~GHVN01059604.1.p1  ORF type:complete len:753 (+),score=46.21 GHVN01059604.1:2507-4765(+)